MSTVAPSAAVPAAEPWPAEAWMHRSEAFAEDLDVARPPWPPAPGWSGVERRRPAARSGPRTAGRAVPRSAAIGFAARIGGLLAPAAHGAVLR